MERRTAISAVIPAWNESGTIGATLRALKHVQPQRYDMQLIVVDDGSDDDTAGQAEPYADRVIRLTSNQGKGTALESGCKAAECPYIVFLDADLGETARHVPTLLKPLWDDELDMSIACLPDPKAKGGFGLVKRAARTGIYRLCGWNTVAPLSGQRALKREMLRELFPLSSGFGVEVGLTIDAVRAGYRVGEVAVPFRHRETGRDLAGFYHRGKQFVEVTRTLLEKRRPVR